MQRYVVYLAPLMFLAMMLAPGRVEPVRGLLAVVVSAALLLALPAVTQVMEQAALFGSTNRLGQLVSGFEAARHPSTGIALAALWVGGAGMWLLTRSGDGWRGGALPASALVLVLLVVQVQAVAHSHLDFIHRARAEFPAHLDWIERQSSGPVGLVNQGQFVAYNRAQGLLIVRPAYWTEFFNPSVDTMYVSPEIQREQTGGICLWGYARDGGIAPQTTRCHPVPRQLVFVPSPYETRFKVERQLALAADGPADPQRTGPAPALLRAGAVRLGGQLRAGHRGQRLPRPAGHRRRDVPRPGRHLHGGRPASARSPSARRPCSRSSCRSARASATSGSRSGAAASTRRSRSCCARAARRGRSSDGPLARSAEAPAARRHRSATRASRPRRCRARHARSPRARASPGAADLARRAGDAQWLSLAALYVASLVVYGLLSRQQSVPWLFPDEFIYGNVAQNIAHGAGANWRGEGQGVPLLYPIVLSFPFRIGSAVDGYGWAKLLGVALSSAVVVPVWLLARELVGHRLALVAAALSIAGAWMSYSSLLISENLALPLAVSACLAATVMALRRPGSRWIWVAIGVRRGRRPTRA